MLQKGEDWDHILKEWKNLKTDPGATYDKEFVFEAADIEPMVTYGTNPGMGIGISQQIPNSAVNGGVQEMEKALNYMGLQPNQKLHGKK